MKKRIFFIFSVFFSVWGASQNTDSLLVLPKFETSKTNCSIEKGRKKLKGRSYASAPALYLRANNEKYTYAVFQLGKRANRIYLFFNVLEKSACVKNEKVLDIFFADGQIISLKNKHNINCEGIFACVLKTSVLKKFSTKTITKIKLYTYDRDYDFFISENIDNQIDNYIKCLKIFRF